MPPVPIKIRPGVDVQSTALTDGATSWAESRNIRFFQGLAQKLGGFEHFADAVPDGGRPVALRAWAALSGIKNLAIAGEDRVSLFAAETVSDLTPYTGYRLVFISISTEDGSATITVQDGLHNALVGDWIRFVAPIAVGGIVLDGPYRVDSVVDSANYTITAAVEATATVANGGAARVFDTTLGDATVTVTFADHGLSSGGITRVPADLAVGGLVLFGNYIVTVVNSGSYTIEAATPAPLSATMPENSGNIAIQSYARRATAVSATVEPFISPPGFSGLYATGNTLIPVGGTGTAPVFIVTETAAVIITVNAVGSGGTPGQHLFQGTTGTGALFQFTADVAGDGTLTGAIPVITVPGAYTANPTSLIGEPITDLTDGTLVGGTVNVGMWPLTVIVSAPGNLTGVPDNPVATTGGTGLGAQLNITWGYGVSTQNPLHVEDVSLDTFGEFLVIVAKQGPVSIWQPAQGVAALPENVLSAPQANTIMFVASQQRIVVVGGSVSFASGLFDPMLMRWSDAGDYTLWTPSSGNQAGSFRLQIGSMIVGGLPIQGQNLIWTDLALYSMQYLGPPFIWGFQPIGVNCGLVGPKAVNLLGGFVAWMSTKQFYVRSGGGAPTVIPCSVWDEVFKNLDPAYLRQTVCTTNSFFGEMAWYVRQLDGTTTRAKLQVDSGVWDYTTIPAGSIEARSAGTDQNVFGAPFGASPEGVVYHEEVGTDADTLPLETRLLTGIAMLAEGDQMIRVSGIDPDVKFANAPGEGTGTLKMTVYVYRNAQAAPRIKGPYLINARTRTIPCHCRGRGLQFEFASDDKSSWWRLGEIKWLGQPDGRGG